jgi:lipoprotein NlpD
MTRVAYLSHRGALAAALCLLLAVAGCANTGQRAPVEDRSAPGRAGTGTASPAAAAPAAAPAEAAKPPPPGAENAGKPGYFTVRPGDTLIRVGLETGQNWRDIARWNGIDNPNVIEVGQVRRVVPPAADANGVVVRPVLPSGRVEGRPLDGRPATAAPGASAPAGTPAVAAPPAVVPAAPAPTPAPAAREGDDELGWAWPASGPVVTPFDDNRSKGLAIGGKAGDPVLAAADGRVVYAGSGLRGYGNLVIVKHNNTYLTAYAHNQALLVKEDQLVRKGQKIAEMGSSDADRVQLHFEIRRQGKPVDPARLLPSR